MVDQARALGMDMMRAYRMLQEHRKLWGVDPSLSEDLFEIARALTDFRPSTRVAWVRESPDLVEFKVLIFLLRSRAKRLHPKLQGELADLVRDADAILSEIQIALGGTPIKPVVKRERWYRHFEPN